MRIKVLSPASGIGVYAANTQKVIRFVRKGCTNRPFFHIVVAEQKKEQFQPVIEQVGSFDPLPNEKNEKLVAFNFERIRWWIGNGAVISKPVEELLGLAGLYPIHPTTYMKAWRRRQEAEKAAVEEKTESK